MNQRVILEGAAIRPELRYTETGLAVLSFTVAAQTREEGGPVYIPVRAVGKLAEAVAPALEGEAVGVLVEGRFGIYREEGRPDRHSVEAERVRPFRVREEDLTPPDAKGGRRLKGGLSLFVGTGKLARDVEVSRGGSTPFARGTLAVLWEKGTDFIPFVAFGPLAEALEGLGKGTSLYVRGRVVHESWTASSGERRFGLRVEAEAARLREDSPRMADEPIPL